MNVVAQHRCTSRFGRPLAPQRAAQPAKPAPAQGPARRRFGQLLVVLTLSTLAGLFLTVGTAHAQEPDLAADKTNNVNGTVSPRSPFLWTIVVTNQGSAAAAIPDNTLLVSDALPSGPDYGAVSIDASGIDNLNALSCNITSLVLTCRAVGDVVTLNAGAAVTLTLPVTPTAVGNLVNPAVPGLCRADPTDAVAESDDNVDPGSANNNCADTVAVARADLTVTKSNDTGGSLPVTDTFTWTLAVANIGAGAAVFPAGSTLLWDELPAAATYSQPTISGLAGVTSGQVTCAVQAKVLSCTADGTVILPAGTGGFAAAVTVTPLSAGVLSNLLTACSVDTADVIDESNEANNSCSDAVTVTGVDLALQKLTTSTLVSPGDTIIYTLAYENLGDELATGVTLSETVPVGTVYMAAGSAAWSCADGASGGTACQLALPDLAGGADDSAIFKVRILDPLDQALAAINNVAEIRDDGAHGPDGDPEDNRDAVSVTLGAFPKIVVEQQATLVDDADGDSVPSPGDTLRYTLRVENQGKVPATLVNVTNEPGVNAPLVVGSVTSSAGTITQGNTAGDTDVALDLGTLASGAQVDATFDVKIAAPLPAGVNTISSQSSATGGNFAQVFSDDPGTAAPSDPTVTQVTAQAAIDATMVAELFVDADQDGVTSPGDRLRYVVTITNRGNRNASGVTFVDVADPNTTLVPGSALVNNGRGVITKGNTPGDANVEATIGGLAGLDDSVTLAYVVTIDAALPATVNIVVRQGIIGSEQLPNVLTDDPALPGNDDATITTVSSAAALVADLHDVLSDDADGNGQATPGDTLEYVVIVRNQGNKGALNVVFRNALPDDVARTAVPVGTTRGTVTSGNGLTDRTVTVEIGAVGAGERVEIRYQVLIDPDLPVTVRSIANQGVVQAAAGEDVNTDDPDTPGAGDPTITPIRADVVIYSTLRDYLWSDADDDRRISAGDILLYRMDIYNFGLRTATDARVNVPESARLTVVNGSVQTSVGNVAVGNAPGDSRITVELTDIAPEAHVILTFRMEVEDVTGLQSIAQQARTRFLAPDGSVFTVFSDDPDTPLIGDPTVSTLYSTAPPPVQYLPLIWRGNSGMR